VPVLGHELKCVAELSGHCFSVFFLFPREKKTAGAAAFSLVLEKKEPKKKEESADLKK
jgi:hypothetical protein